MKASTRRPYLAVRALKSPASAKTFELVPEDREALDCGWKCRGPLGIAEASHRSLNLMWLDFPTMGLSAHPNW